MGADVAIAGMWLGIDDGILNPATVKLGPRKIVIAAEKDSLTPLQTGADFQLSEAMVAKLQAAIRKTLMADQLQPWDGPQMTARSEEHTSELQSLMRRSYAVFCLKKKNNKY